jgi:teichuronic acid biosynthesis glycosyltransferase TuaC
LISTDARDAMRILTFTTLYPNAAQPQHGVFVENRLRQLVGSGRVAARVVAPTPWFPLDHPRFGAYAKFARVPRREERHGLAIEHPRYLVAPRVGMTLSPVTLYLAARRAIAPLRAAGWDFDLIDAHYFYPDGVAAALLAGHFRRPFVVTARGTDINLIPQFALPRRMIRWAAGKADAMVAVCQALKDEMAALGLAAARIRVLRNGVDLDTFRPHDRAPARARLGLTGPTLLSVGALIERKGHHVTIGALPLLPGVGLMLAGEGEERPRLAALAQRLGVADRVRFLGQQPHDALPALYSAADVSVLSSNREGWANVLLESMACGTPVVATDAWGTPEVVAAPEAGRLMAARTPEACAAAVTALLADPPDRAATRRYAEGFSWAATTRGQIELFTSILERRRA